MPDFPEPGVLFRDLSPLFADAGAFKAVIDALAGTVGPDVEALAGVEARGFLLAAAVGYARGLGVVLIRKPGKLPQVAGRVDYALEYGTATVELPAGVVRPGQRVAVLDDVLATGGTVRGDGQAPRRRGSRRRRRVGGPGAGGPGRPRGPRRPEGPRAEGLLSGLPWTGRELRNSVRTLLLTHDPRQA